MMMIPFSADANLESGVPATINGHETTVFKDGDFLTYTDEKSERNRCRILFAVPIDQLPMPDGTVVRGVHYTCASHGDDEVRATPSVAIPGLVTFSRPTAKMRHEQRKRGKGKG